MGASKNEFINCRMAMELYEQFDRPLREQIIVLSVDDDLPEYKQDEVLRGLYKQKAKISDEIKRRQYAIKNKFKH